MKTVSAILLAAGESLRMGEVNKLTANGGKLNVDDYQRTVDTLLGSDSDPVINAEPVGAWTHKVWDAAFGS